MLRGAGIVISEELMRQPTLIFRGARGGGLQSLARFHLDKAARRISGLARLSDAVQELGGCPILDFLPLRKHNVLYIREKKA